MALSQSIEVVVDDGQGGTRVVRKEIPTTGFAVKLDGSLYSPVVTTNVEIENDGQTSSTMDQCGRTERQRTGDNGWLIRVQGIVTGEERDGNLSLSLLRDTVASLDEVEIRSDLISGTYVVSNTVITQANDLVSIETSETVGREKAFEFQLQLGEQQTQQ